MYARGMRCPSVICVRKRKGSKAQNAICFSWLTPVTQLIKDTNDSKMTNSASRSATLTDESHGTPTASLLNLESPMYQPWIENNCAEYTNRHSGWGFPTRTSPTWGEAYFPISLQRHGSRLMIHEGISVFSNTKRTPFIDE